MKTILSHTLAGAAGAVVALGVLGALGASREPENAPAVLRAHCFEVVNDAGERIASFGHLGVAGQSGDNPVVGVILRGRNGEYETRLMAGPEGGVLSLGDGRGRYRTVLGPPTPQKTPEAADQIKPLHLRNVPQTPSPEK